MKEEELLRIPEDAGAHRPLWEKVFSTATLDSFRSTHGRSPETRQELVKFFPQLMGTHKTPQSQPHT